MFIIRIGSIDPVFYSNELVYVFPQQLLVYIRAHLHDVPCQGWTSKTTGNETSHETTKSHRPVQDY